MITGIRGLCNGLGPALYGFVFFLFNVELNTMDPIQGDFNILPLNNPTEVNSHGFVKRFTFIDVKYNKLQFYQL